MNKNGGQKAAASASRSSSFCRNCRRKIRGEDGVLLVEYMKSIEYINYCHKVMNHFLRQSKEKMPGLPRVPNFCAVFAEMCPAFANAKEKTFRQDLDKIESLHDVYACIESLGLDKNWSDSEIEFGGKTEKDAHTSGCLPSDNPGKHLNRSSSIPRPVIETGRRKPSSMSSESTKELAKSAKLSVKLKTDVSELIQEEGVRKFAARSPSMSSKHKSRERRENENKTSSNNMALSQDDLDKFAKELLGSCSDSPLTSPRTTASTNSRSPSPKNYKTPVAVKISYKTRSDLNLKVPPKPKSKPSLRRQSAKTQKKQSITICEPTSSTKTPIKNKTDQKRIVNQTCPSSPKRNTPSGKKLQSGDVNSQSPENIEDDGSDIEPDDSRQLSMLMVRDSVKQKHLKQEVKRMVTQKPDDAFRKSHRTPERIVKKHCYSDTESEKEHKQHSESDIDEHVFDNRPLNDNQELAQRNNTYNMLKMSALQTLPKSLLASIGILQQSEMSPEKEQEMETVLLNRAKDKRNSSFRQPRRPTKDVLEIARLSPNIVDRDSPHSSEGKTDDEEEICTHRFDEDTIYGAYKMRYRPSEPKKSPSQRIPKKESTA